MQQSKPPAAASTVARQLDFAASLNSMILPGHPQAQLEMKLRALAQSRAQSPPRVAALPPKSSQKEILPLISPPETAAKVAVLGLSEEPVSLHYSAFQPMISKEPPEMHQRSNPEQATVTPNKKRKCSCKNSRCLKLYCECFALGTYCDECNCINCCNKIAFEENRRDAIRTTLERKPDAFKSKLENSPDRVVEHNRGCSCKKTSCLKKYCECYQANTLCSEKCKCFDCKNYVRSEERKVHFLQHQAYSLTLQQSRNGAYGSPHKKLKTLEFRFFDLLHRPVSTRLPLLDQKGISSMSDIFYAPVSAGICKPASRHPKHSYRSALCGILQEEHIQDFCNTMVRVTARPAKSLSVWSPQEDKEDDSKASISTASNLGVRFDAPDRRPLSPETQALICDEQARTFMGASANKESDKTITEMQLSGSMHDLTQSYIEQERLVLAHFCNFLNMIIIRGSTRESKMELEPE